MKQRQNHRRGTKPSRSKASIERHLAIDLAWGIGWGLFGGVFFMCIAVVVVYGLIGGFDDAPEGMTPWLSALYPSCGVLAGVVVGICRPYLRSRTGSMLAGSVAALPWSVALNGMANGPITSWGALEILGVVISAATWGAMAGYVLWRQLHDFGV